MLVAVIVLGVVVLFLLAVATGTLLACRDLNAVVEMQAAQIAHLEDDNRHLRAELAVQKEKYGSLWRNVCTGFRELKREMEEARSRHLDADAQEGE
jgi:hypothetical protein